MIAATVWNGTESKLGQIEVADLMREESGVGVVLALKTVDGGFNAQLDLNDAAELIATLVETVRTQYAVMGEAYVRP